ncbi:MAG: glycosyltransferase family 2 protein [Mycobacterium sp.]
MRTTQRSHLFRPVCVAEWDLVEPVPAFPLDPAENGGASVPVLLLIRLGTEPLGHVSFEAKDNQSFSSTAVSVVMQSFHSVINVRLAASDLPLIEEITANGLAVEPNQLGFVIERNRMLEDAPDVSVVLCTRDRPKRVADCIRRLASQEYSRYEIVVVDNAPADPDAVPAVLESIDTPIPLRYVLEPRGGLSWARNAGWKAATADIIAFLDDDEIPDKHWLAELVRGFSARSDVGCVTGMVLPAELKTEPQQWFEGLGGFRQGRGFAREVFGPEHPQSPLYPFPPFGAGANMAFRRDVLTDIDGFDVALGAGTPAKASEETLAFARARLAEHTIVYQPTALVSHFHRETLAELKTQLHNYSIGTTAHYTALIIWKPRLLLTFLLLIPRAIKENLPWNDPQRAATMRSSPAILVATQVVGMLKGPFAYIKSSRRQRGQTTGASAVTTQASASQSRPTE